MSPQPEMLSPKMAREVWDEVSRSDEKASLDEELGRELVNPVEDPEACGCVSHA